MCQLSTLYASWANYKTWNYPVSASEEDRRSFFSLVVFACQRLIQFQRVDGIIIDSTRANVSIPRGWIIHFVLIYRTQHPPDARSPTVLGHCPVDKSVSLRCWPNGMGAGEYKIYIATQVARAHTNHRHRNGWAAAVWRRVWQLIRTAPMPFCGWQQSVVHPSCREKDCCGVYYLRASLQGREWFRYADVIL